MMNNPQSHLQYSEECYPPDMKHLPTDVRRKAIQISNRMMVDGNVRYHKDLITVIAISEARRWGVEQEKTSRKQKIRALSGQC